MFPQEASIEHDPVDDDSIEDSLHDDSDPGGSGVHPPVAAKQSKQVVKGTRIVQ